MWNGSTKLKKSLRNDNTIKAADVKAVDAQICHYVDWDAFCTCK